jgi:hypothetical protein
MDCGVNISTATLVKIIAKTPRGNKKEWVGSISGTNSIRYLLQASDIDQAGTWELQAYVAMPGWAGRGAWAELKVSA